MTELHVRDFPGWLTAISAVSLMRGIVLALVVAIDVKRRPRPPLCAAGQGAPLET